MEDENDSEEIAPARTEPEIETRQEDVIAHLLERVAAIEAELASLHDDIQESDASDDGTTTELPAGSGEPEPAASDVPPEAETQDKSGDVKRPDRRHPYYRKLW